MKKIFNSIILFTLAILLISCGKKFKVYSAIEKEKIIKGSMNHNAEDRKTYNEVLNVLIKEMNNGNVEAKKEYDEWQSIQEEINFFKKDLSKKRIKDLSKKRIKDLDSGFKVD